MAEAKKSIVKSNNTKTSDGKIISVREAIKMKSKIIEEFNQLKDSDKLEVLKSVGVGGDSTEGRIYTCYLCGEPLFRKEFHGCTDFNCVSGVARICKTCADKIAYPVDNNGNISTPDKKSVKETLEYLDKPFLEGLWESSLLEAANEVTGKTKSSVYKSYIKNISMQQYLGKRYHDGDDFGGVPIPLDEEKKEISQEAKEMFEINKKTTIRFLGYDPFENEPLNEQPLLYAKLVNYFDDSVKDDGLKLEAVIEIVQSFKDVKTINDAISKYKKQLVNNPQVISTIKSLADTKQKMINSALALAKDNGISVNYNNSKSKGAGTLSGIIKEMSEMNLDAIEINTFYYETNIAISQIMDMNFQNQMKQLNPDENDWEKEILHQAKLLKSLQSERDNAVEYCRKLKKENKDLKEFLFEKGIINEALEVVE